MPSFDIVSEIDLNEVRNAVEQTARELNTRFDLRDSNTTIEQKQGLIELTSPNEMALRSAGQLLKEKLARREISLKAAEFKEFEKIGGDLLKQEVILKESLDEADRKQVVAAVKGLKTKVQTQIQGVQVRVTGKKRDELQSVIQHLKSQNFRFELQFNNFRD